MLKLNQGKENARIGECTEGCRLQDIKVSRMKMSISESDRMFKQEQSEVLAIVGIRCMMLEPEQCVECIHAEYHTLAQHGMLSPGELSMLSVL